MEMSGQRPLAQRASLQKRRGYTGELVTKTRLTLGSQGWPSKCQSAYVGDGPDNVPPSQRPVQGEEVQSRSLRETVIGLLQ